MTLRLPLSLPRKKSQSQLQPQLPHLLPPYLLRRMHQPTFRPRRRLSQPNLPLPLQRPQLKQHPLQSPPRTATKLLPRPTPRNLPQLPHLLQVSAPPTSRKRRRSVPSVLYALVSRLTRRQTRLRRLSAHSALASKPAPFPRV